MGAFFVMSHKKASVEFNDSHASFFIWYNSPVVI